MNKNNHFSWGLTWASLLVVAMGCGWSGSFFAQQENLAQSTAIHLQVGGTSAPGINKATASSTLRATSTRTPTVVFQASSTPTRSATPTPLPTATSTSTPLPSPAVLIGAGDISVCGLYEDKKTAALLKKLVTQYPHAEIFTAGDNVQINGDMFEYTDCFGPTWGRFRERLHPSPGNHDWYAAEGKAYFDYFVELAGPDRRGYYSYELGEWHIVSLNSNCDTVSCDENSQQARWLKADLQQNPKRCTMLYWHHPLWDSGLVPISQAGAAFWKIAVEMGVDVVVNGHDHHYERFAPMNANGEIDPYGGVRAFIVGTGGAWLFELGDPLPATEVRDNETLGVMRFLLYPDHYSWTFYPVEGSKFTDAGVDVCH
jgi:acid phosphatase type 7